MSRQFISKLYQNSRYPRKNQEGSHEKLACRGIVVWNLGRELRNKLSLAIHDLHGVNNRI